jgi:mono/diheme cytochrome c family protein
VTRRSGLCLVALAALALAPGGSTEVPWPHGSPPTGAELRELIDSAVELADRERLEEFQEAAFRGDDHEHIFLLQSDIDLGLYNNDSLFRFGDGLFGHEFRREDGYAATVSPRLQRVHNGVRGGLDTFSCAGCHSVGGPDGAGGPTQNAFLGGDGDRMSSTNPRNAPAALGLGLVQALAAEMTTELQALRDDAIALAAETGAPTATSLTTKSVDFGVLIAMPDGSLDTSGVEGVSEDLVVRPFGWKGSGARLRRFIEDAARIHFGVQSHVLALAYQNEPDVARLGSGPDWFDPDGDGVARELEEGILTAGAVYLALLEAPVILPPRDPELVARWGEGAVLFDAIGCADCHRVDVVLKDITWEEWPDTTDGPPYVVNLLTDGEQPRGTQSVKLFSDLKRHAMGEGLADPHDDPSGLPRDVFLTRPLWGLAETAPYLHDGRAATIPEAILAHGGEARGSRDAFAALSAVEQASVHVFLLSLTREPKVRVAR